MSLDQTTKCAVVYTRCSTEYQAVDGTSIQYQIKVCQDFAQHHNITIKGIFVEKAKTGRTLKGRVQLQKTFNMLNKGDILLVYSLSRVARSLQDSAKIDEIIENKGSVIISATEYSMMQGKGGEFNKAILQAVAQQESKMIADRVKDSMYHRKEVIGTSNNRSHYGWKYDNKVKSQDGKLLPIPVAEEQKIVHIIKELRNTKYKNPKYPNAKEQDHTPYAVIAHHLNTSGIPTRSKKAGDETSEWHAQTIKNILEYEAGSISQEMEALRQRMKDDDLADIIVYTGYIYIVTSGTCRKFGFADTLEKVFKQASVVSKKPNINIYRCKDQEKLCDNFGAWLLAEGYRTANEDDIIEEDAQWDLIFTYIKQATGQEPICTTIGDIPKLFDREK